MISPTCTAGICLGLPRLSFKTSGEPASAGYFCLSRVGCARSHATMPNERLSTLPQLWSSGSQQRSYRSTIQELWHHLLHGGVHRGGCVHPSVTPKITGLMGHRSVPCSFCPNLGHSKGGLPTPLPGMAWIPRPGFCFGRLLSAHTVCLYVPCRLFAAQAAQASSLEAPAWAYANPIPALAVLGRHALPFYLLHQPVILGVLEIVYSVR